MGMKKAPVGFSGKMKNGAPKSAAKGLKALHAAGKTVPLYGSERTDKLSQVKGTGGVAKK